MSQDPKENMTPNFRSGVRAVSTNDESADSSDLSSSEDEKVEKSTENGTKELKEVITTKTTGEEQRAHENELKDDVKVISEPDANQLLGKDSPNDTKMHIGKDIYCTKTSHTYALTAKTSSSVARRLLEGIFQEQVLIEATLTGRSGSTEQDENKNSMVALCKVVVDYIIAYAIRNGKQKEKKATIWSGEPYP